MTLASNSASYIQQITIEAALEGTAGMMDSAPRVAGVAVEVSIRF